MDPATPQPTASSSGPLRAATDEPVMIVVSPVKADQWEQHEHFVRNILLPASEKLDPVAHRQVRFLVPTKQNEDGTYTAIFLMDPRQEGLAYDIQEVLAKVYGEQQAEEYLQRFVNTLAGDQVVYEMRQSSW
ncbi:MAG: hypothetical protein M3R24_41665 [Chloroflexota bacterium]|nr:hypothetical protein [Chloroflexota bacterium]